MAKPRITPENISDVRPEASEEKKVLNNVAEKPPVVESAKKTTEENKAAKQAQKKEKIQPKEESEDNASPEPKEEQKSPTELSSREIEKIGNARERGQREFWAKEPQVQVYIPFNPGEENLKTVPDYTLDINGAKLSYSKGEYHSVPESVAKTIMDSLNQTNKALRTKRAENVSELV